MPKRSLNLPTYRIVKMQTGCKAFEWYIAAKGPFHRASIQEANYPKEIICGRQNVEHRNLSLRLRGSWHFAVEEITFRALRSKTELEGSIICSICASIE